MLRPHHQLEHLRAVEVLHRDGDAEEAEQQLREQQQQHHDVHRPAGGADARLGQPAVDEQDRGRRGTAAPAMPPATIASICLAPAETPSACQIASGVSRPTRWPKKMPRMPMWNRLEPQRSWPRAQQLRRVALPRVLVAVEAHQAADEEDRQRDVGIDAEQELVEVGHRVCSFIASCPGGGVNCITADCGRLRGAATPGAPRGAEDHRLLDPLVVERLLLRRRRCRGACAAQARLADHRQQRGEHRGVAAAAVAAAPRRPRAGCARSRRACPSPRPRAAATGTRAPPAGSRAARWPASTKPCARVDRPSGRPSPGRGRASRRARARTGAATSRGRGRTARRRLPARRAGRRAASSSASACSASLCGARQPRLARRRRRDLRQRGDEVRGRVGEQRGERLEVMRHGHAPAPAIFTVIGMVFFFLPPNRLASLCAVGAAVAEREAAAAAHVERVLGVLAVRGRDDEAVLVVGDRHVAVHLLDLRDRQADLLQHRGVLALLDVAVAHVGAHRQHPLERGDHRRLVAGGQQVGEVLHRDAQRAHVGQLAERADLAGVGRRRDRRQRRHVPDHRQRAVLRVQRQRDLPVHRHLVDRRSLRRLEPGVGHAVARAPARSPRDRSGRGRRRAAPRTAPSGPSTDAAASMRSAS